MERAGGVFSNPELQAGKDNRLTWSHLSKYDIGRMVVPLTSGTLVDYDLAQWGLFARHIKRCRQNKPVGVRGTVHPAALLTMLN